MAVLNKGAAIEGIFGICLALILTTDKVEKPTVLKYRAKADPAKFLASGQRIELEKLRDSSGDIISTTIFLRMKKDAAGAYGDIPEGFEELDDKKLDRYTDSIVTNMKYIPSVQKMIREKKKFLKNAQLDDIRFMVEIDGVTGESSGGDIKTDVAASLKVVSNKKEIPVTSERVLFSLKGDSTSIESKGISKIFESLIEEFKLRPSATINAASRMLNSRPKTQDGRQLRNDAGFIGFREVFAQLKKLEQQNSTNFNTRAYNYLSSCLFGVDHPEVVKVGITNLKVLDGSILRSIKKSNVLGVRYRETPASDYIEFYTKQTNTVMFHVRLGMSGDKFQVKVEAGPFLYSLAKILPNK